MNVDIEQIKQRYSTMDTDELLKIHAQGSLIDEAYDALETELRNRNKNIPERPTIDDINESQVGFWRAQWLGEKSLSSAFLQVGVVGNLVVLGIAFAIGLVITDGLEKSSSNFMLFISIVLSIFTPYFIFSCVSVWRCAVNVKWHGWTVIARLVVVLWVLRYLQVVTGNA